MIIVTLSVVCTLKGMSRWSIQRIKAILLYCVCYVVCQQCQHIQRKLIPLNALEILMPSVNSVDIYSIDGMVETPSVSAFQNFLQIENWLNIKKVIGRNV